MNTLYFAGQTASAASRRALRCQAIAVGRPRAPDGTEATDCRVFSTHFPPTSMTAPLRLTPWRYFRPLVLLPALGIGLPGYLAARPYPLPSK